MAKILIVEDEPTLLGLLQRHFQSEGYAVTACADGELGLDALRADAPDVCIFDVMLPKLDGLSLCRIAAKESEAVIILLTARGAENDRVIGLENGADDYVVKPFSLPELTARVRAALRRSHRRSDNDVLEHGALRVDLTARKVTFNNQPLKLSHKEFELLATLLRNRNAVLTRDFLLAQVWGYDYEGDPRTLDVHIRWLREKIEADPSAPQIIHTVRGIGYRIE